MTNAVSYAGIENVMKNYAKASYNAVSTNKFFVPVDTRKRDSFVRSDISSAQNTAAIKAIYRRMTSGAKVSSADENKLKELDPKMYSAAKNAQMKAAQAANNSSKVTYNSIDIRV